MTLTGIRGLFACKDVAIPWRREYLGHCQNIGLCPYYFLPETKHDAIQGIILVTRYAHRTGPSAKVGVCARKVCPLYWSVSQACLWRLHYTQSSLTTCGNESLPVPVRKSKDKMGGRMGHVQLSTERMLAVHIVALTKTEGKIGVAYWGCMWFRSNLGVRMGGGDGRLKYGKVSSYLWCILGW